MRVSRRTFLNATSASATMAALGPGVTGYFAAAAEPAQRDILVVVFLRFGCDGLTMIPPADDAVYHANRPTIVVPSSGLGAGLPIGTMDGVQMFLHPNIPDIKALYDAEQLAIVHAAGVAHRKPQPL